MFKLVKKDDEEISQILPNLFLGSFVGAKDQYSLKKKKITHIFIIAQELYKVFPNDYKYFQFQVIDVAFCNILLELDKICDQIHQAITQENGNILVHCALGVSRSATAIIAYLMKYQNMNFYQAKEFVQRKRRIANPNSGFINQLQEFEKKLKQQHNQQPQQPETNSNIQITRDKTQNEISTSNDLYKCRQCQTQLFNKNDILHQKDYNNPSQNCLYIKQLKWIQTNKSLSGAIKCPNLSCQNVIGVFNFDPHKCKCGNYFENSFKIQEYQIYNK